jgi:L-alanine-DL-glutamate epimerase-like enolase superfamily enzyme
MTIQDIQVEIVKIPFKKPFTMAMWTSREKIHVVVRLTGDDGTVGIGETVPLVAEFGEPAASIKMLIEEYYKPVLIGVDVFDTEEIYRRMYATAKFHWFAISAVDFALYDLMGKAAGVPSYQFLGGMVHRRLPLNWVIGIQEPEDAGKEALHHYNQGYRSFKLKNRDPDSALKTIKAVREAVGDASEIRIDPNQSWSVSGAIAIIRKLEKYRPECIEQPLPYWDLEGMAMVRRSVGTPIMADEGVRTIHDAMRAVRLGSADIINLKIAKSGGIFYSRKIADIAEMAGLECIVGSMLEGWIGTAAGAHIGVACKSVQRGCDLIGPLHHSDMIEQESSLGFSYENGHLVIHPERFTGLGVELDEAKMRQYKVG